MLRPHNIDNELMKNIARSLLHKTSNEIRSERIEKEGLRCDHCKRVGHWGIDWAMSDGVLSCPECQGK